MTLDHTGKVRIVTKEVCLPRYHLIWESTCPHHPLPQPPTLGIWLPEQAQGQRVWRLAGFLGPISCGGLGTGAWAPLPGNVPCWALGSIISWLLAALQGDIKAKKKWFEAKQRGWKNREDRLGVEGIWRGLGGEPGVGRVRPRKKRN